MTNKEAIEVLKAYYTDSCYYALLQDAINTAIDALSAEPTDEAVKEYCRKRDLSLISNDLFYKMSSAQPTLKSDSDAEFWENRATEYSKIIASLVADMSKGINFESMQITKTGKITFGRAEQELIHCGDCKYKDDGIDEDGIPFLKCLNDRSYGGTRINDYCSWAERRKDG